VANGNIFQTSTLGTSNNSITFNDTAASPFYRLTDRYVLGRQIRDFDIPLPEAMGVADFQTLVGKSNYLLGGIMYPGSENEYDTGIRTLRKIGNLQYEQDDADSDGGYVPYKWNDSDGIPKFINVKVLYTDLRESSRRGLKVPFRLFGKVKSPVVLAQTSTTAQVGNASATTSGSSNLPWVLPLAIGLTTYSSNGTINNAGDLPAYPTITITGPITTPRITNSTTGEYIELSGINLSTVNDSVILTYDQDSIALTQAGNSIFNSLTSGSTLFTISPGTNSLTLTGATVGTGATATVSINSTWALS
jgi:hypothetical protein